MQILVAVLCCAALSLAIPIPPESEGTMDFNNDMEVELEEGGDSPDPEQLYDYLQSLLTEDSAPLPLVYLPEKRSRYYRRYPWKRQNGYEPDTYLCTPSKQDLFQLLMALHEARSGNLDRQVHFCNRRRPARAIFTNIRFLGRR